MLRLNTLPPNVDITRAAGCRGQRYACWHTRARVNRAQVGCCASSVAYMRCSAGRGTVRWYIHIYKLHRYFHSYHIGKSTHIFRPIFLDTFLVLPVFARQSAGSTAAVGAYTRGRLINEACIHHIVPWALQMHLYFILYKIASIILLMCTCICIYFVCGSALIRAGGTTAHLGAVATVLHGCPALIRAIGTTVQAGAVATVPHGCPALIRAIGTTGLFSAR
jgi:hypothetical protein